MPAHRYPTTLYIDAAPIVVLKLAPEAFSCILPFLDLILASTVYLELIAAELIVVDRF